MKNAQYKAMEYLFAIQCCIVIFGICLSIKYIMQISTLAILMTVIGTIATTVTFVSDIADIHTSLNEMIGGYLAWLLFGAVITLMAFTMLISMIFVLKSADFLIHKNWCHLISVTISEESKKHLGGYLIFDVKHTSWLFAGYFVIHLQSPYWEEKSVSFRYNDGKKLGYLNGKYKEKTIQLRCNIPKHWGSGKYDIAVKINDVCALSFGIRKTMTVSEKILYVQIK